MTYAFNPQGLSGPNTIQGEQQTLTPPTTGNYNYLIPINGPFFVSSLTVTITPTAENVSNLPLGVNSNLTPYVDFFPALEFAQATSQCGQAVYGAISFTDPTLAGLVTISYTTIGGIWTVARSQQLALIANQTVNPRTTAWEDAFSLPDTFPPVQLSFAEQQVVGFDTVVTLLGDIANVYTTSSPPQSPISYNDHIANLNNPHGDTAATFGLGLVPNWRMSTTAEAAAGTAFNLFVSPAGAFQATKSLTVLPHASKTAYGTLKLNLGDTAGEDTDNTRALTTAGLLALKSAAGSNAIKALFSYERQVVTFTPAPIQYPVLCLGVLCKNWGDLVAAVQTNLGFSPIESSASRFCIYLPHDMPTPNLTVTPQ